MKALLDNLPLSGNKTYISGIIMIVTGVSGAVMKIIEPESPLALPFDRALELVLGGLAVLGIGHKIDKASK
jgi:hypothetical protein